MIRDIVKAIGNILSQMLFILKYILQVQKISARNH